MQLARDIQSCDQRVIIEVKRIASAGYEGTLAAGLLLEENASNEHSARNAPERQVAERRLGVQDRGREQLARQD